MRNAKLRRLAGLLSYKKKGIPMVSLPSDGRDHHLAKIIVRRVATDRFTIELQTDDQVTAHVVGPTEIPSGGSLTLNMPENEPADD